MSVLPFNAQAPVWADVTPVPQDDGPSPLCPILYSPNYSQAMDLLRALLPADELSPRSLALTEHLVQLCPSNYTVWQFRARILIHGPEDDDEVNGLGSKKSRLGNELQFLDQLAQANMKSYQVWQHRKLVVGALGDPSRELSFVERVLDEDSKNYHTWVYRQWVLAHFGGLPGSKSEGGGGAAMFPVLWHGELAFVDKLLGEDARNNSAWNHRYYCLFASGWANACDQQSATALHACQQEWKVGSSFADILQNEIAYAKDHVKLVPNNASAWNYLRGVAKLSHITNPFAQAAELARSLSQKDAPPPLAMEWLLDDIHARIRENDKEGQALLPDAESLVQQLVEVDPIRRRYWHYRLAMVKRASAS